MSQNLHHLLSQFAKVNWKLHAVDDGEIDFLRESMEAIVGTDRSAGRTSIEELRDYVFDEPPYRPIAVHLIPLLVDAATLPNLTTRSEILQLLIDFRNATGMSEARRSLVDESEAKSEDAMIEAVHFEIAAAANSYFQVLKQCDQSECVDALHLLSYCHKSGRTVVPKLHTYVANSSDILCASAAMLAICYIENSDTFLPKSTDFFRNIFLNSENSLMKAIASIALARSLGPQCEPDVQSHLRAESISLATESIRDVPELFHRRFGHAWTWGSGRLEDQLWAIRYLDFETSAQMHLDILATAKNPEMCYQILFSYLDLLFMGQYTVPVGRNMEPGTVKFSTLTRMKRVAPITHLSVQQANWLKKLLSLRPIWGYRTNLFELFGLPNDEQKIVELIRHLP